MALPFYFFNKFLQHKINPRQSGRRLLLYFSAVIIAAFIYVTIGIFLIVWVTKFLM
jgi:hypothetical protein